ncbi:MAG TPA: hypothetical protein VE978_05330 [Chitinophagales bacterium]|nr:hypothetical protein [Chitinophagales bacterium]
MNWYSVNFSLHDTAAESETEIFEFFQNYLREHSLSGKSLLYESDELTERGSTVFIYSDNAGLISALSEKCSLNECSKPVKEEICLVAGTRDLGDSLFT